MASIPAPISPSTIETAYFEHHLDLLVTSQCRKYGGMSVFNKIDPNLLDLISSYIVSPKYKFHRKHDYIRFSPNGDSAWIDNPKSPRCNALFGPVLDSKYMVHYGLVFYLKFVVKRCVGVAVVSPKWKSLNSFFSRKKHGTAAHWISYIYHNGWSRGADGLTQSGWNKYVTLKSPLFIRPGTAAVIEIDLMQHRMSITNDRGITISVGLYKMDQYRIAFEIGKAPSWVIVVGHWWKQRISAKAGKRRWWNIGPICEFMSW